MSFIRVGPLYPGRVSARIDDDSDRWKERDVRWVERLLRMEVGRLFVRLILGALGGVREGGFLVR